MITTIEHAQQVMETAEQDVLGDMGSEALEAGYFDLVRFVAEQCSPEVRAEFLARHGLTERR